MNVLADYHQGALYKSLHLLFEKRLGYKLYRPIGMDWFTSGYWKIAEPYGNPPDTIGQYLDINDKEWDSHKNLNGNYRLKDGIYHVWDPENKIHHKAVTFEQFKQMEWDIIVSSYPLHHNWKELPCKQYIVQIGNENQTTDAEKILSSVWMFKPKENQNVMYYHQEFDLEEYKYVPPKNHNRILNVAIKMEERETFEIYKANLPEFIIHTKEDMEKPIAQEMRDSAFGFHIKSWDGYGYVIHNWFALGRPVIARGDYYKGKTGGLLLEDGVTCIDLDQHSFEENLQLIRYWAIPKNHKKMCENVRKRFDEVVNFDKEFASIKDWLII